MILHNVYLRQDGYVFGRVCLFVGLSVRLSDYSKGNKRICIICLPKVCLAPRNNRLDFWDDPDYDPDPRFVLRSDAHGFEWNINPLAVGAAYIRVLIFY